MGGDGASTVESPSIQALETSHYTRWFPRAVVQPIGRVESTVSELMSGAGQGSGGAIPAAYTYFGQLLSHDLSFFSGEPSALRNLRSPMLDLDNVYGDDSRTNAYLFGPNGEFRVDRTGSGDADLPRMQGGEAVIPDFRDDVTIMLSQMHLAWMRFHNGLLRARQGNFVPCTPGTTAFDELRTAVLSVYQWIVVHDYLRRMIDPTVWSAVELALTDLSCWAASPLRLSRIGDSRIPVELVFGVLRFGHAMVRDSYRLNGTLPEISLFPAYGDEPADLGTRSDLFGFRKIPDGWEVDWSLFDGSTQGQFAQRARPIGLSIVASLGRVPEHLAPDLRDPSPDAKRGRLRLAFATLTRSLQLGLPAARTVIQALSDRGHSVNQPAKEVGDMPLWVFVLHEAQQAGGDHLGPVGSILLAEGILGVLANDSRSFFIGDPQWTPAKVGMPANATLGDVLRLSSSPLPPTT